MPTLDELGVKGYEASTFTGIFAPAGTPQAVLSKVVSALLGKRLRATPCASATAAWASRSSTRARREFAAYVRADLEKWRRVAREGNIVVE